MWPPRGPEITASYEQLMEDAVYSVSLYMRRASESVDEQFGKGHAKAHPELVAAMVTSMAREFSGSSRSKVLQGLTEQITEAINELAAAHAPQETL